MGFIGKFVILVVLLASNAFSAPVAFGIEDVPSSYSVYQQKDTRKCKSFAYTDTTNNICNSDCTVKSKIDLPDQQAPIQPSPYDIHWTTIERSNLSSIWKAITRWVRSGGKFSGSVSPLRIPPPNRVRIGDSQALDTAIDSVASLTRGGT